MVLLPEMKDVITPIQSQDSTIAPLGEAINYNEIKLSRSDWVDLMDKIGRDILNHMHQASMTFLWLLGPPHQVSGPSNVRECPIKAQHSELEKFQPLVTQALPNSIWNGEGVFLMEALDELCQQDRIGILKVPNSKLGAGDANASTGNAANQYKIGRYVDITNTTGQGIYGNSNTLMTSTQVQNEFRPYFTTSGGYMYWHDFAVIKLNFLFESLNKIGLTKKLDAQLRLWVNTGTVMVRVDGADSTNLAYNMTLADNTFSNTCPILINYQSSSSAGGSIVPATTKAIVAGLYINKPPTTSFAGINLAASIVQHPLTNCRLYYSQITVDPQKSIDYVQRNRNKKVIFRSFVTNSYNGIGVGSSFNALVNSGIIHPTGILICPFIAATTGTNAGFGDYQWKSPFDTCPATLSPLSLINLQVGIGGQNILNSTLSMTYENFLQQVNLAEQLTSSDFGVSTGLISQGYWEQSEWYFVNVERGNISDKLQPRNINVNFNNNSNVPIDVIIFTFYNDQLTIDVETGIVTK